MKNTKRYLSRLFLISFAIGHFAISAESKASAMAHNQPSKELLQIIALKNAGEEKSQKKRGMIGKMYLKAQRIVKKPIDYVFGKKPSALKKVFYLALGATIVLFIAYGVHEYWLVMEVIKDEERAEKNELEPNIVIEQDEVDPQDNALPDSGQKVNAVKASDQPTITQASPAPQNDEDLPKEQPQNVLEDQPPKNTNNTEKTIVQEPNNIVVQQAVENSKPKNDGTDHQDAREEKQGYREVPQGKQEEGPSTWDLICDAILPGKGNFPSRRDKFWSDWDFFKADLRWLLRLDRPGADSNQEQPKIQQAQNSDNISITPVTPAAQTNPVVVQSKSEPKPSNPVGTQTLDDAVKPVVPAIPPVKNEPNSQVSQSQQNSEPTIVVAVKLENQVTRQAMLDAERNKAQQDLAIKEKRIQEIRMQDETSYEEIHELDSLRNEVRALQDRIKELDCA